MIFKRSCKPIEAKPSPAEPRLATGGRERPREATGRLRGDSRETWYKAKRPGIKPSGARVA